MRVGAACSQQLCFEVGLFELSIEVDEEFSCDGAEGDLDGFPSIDK